MKTVWLIEHYAKSGELIVNAICTTKEVAFKWFTAKYDLTEVSKKAYYVRTSSHNYLVTEHPLYS